MCQKWLLVPVDEFGFCHGVKNTCKKSKNGGNLDEYFAFGSIQKSKTVSLKKKFTLKMQ
jgi:hypothetical protein